MELVENAESVSRIRSAVAGGMSLPSVAAQWGISVQALREVLARHAGPPVDAPVG